MHQASHYLFLLVYVSLPFQNENSMNTEAFLSLWFTAADQRPEHFQTSSRAQESAGWMPGRLNEWTATVIPARLWVNDHETPVLPPQQYHPVHLQHRIYHQLIFHLSLFWLLPIESKPPLERRLFPSHLFIAGCPEPRTVQHMKQKDSIKCVQHEWTPNFPRSNSIQTRHVS